MYFERPLEKFERTFLSLKTPLKTLHMGAILSTYTVRGELHI